MPLPRHEVRRTKHLEVNGLSRNIQKHVAQQYGVTVVAGSSSIVDFWLFVSRRLSNNRIVPTLRKATNAKVTVVVKVGSHGCGESWRKCSIFGCRRWSAMSGYWFGDN